MHYQKRYNGELLGIKETIRGSALWQRRSCHKWDCLKKTQKNIVTRTGVFYDRDR